MEKINSVADYCDKVCEQIRWKKAHSNIKKELENHIYDQSSSYILSGDDEDIATKKAILQMGDAIFVGQEFNKEYKPKSQWLLLGFVGIFMIIGTFINLYISDILDIHYNPITYILAFGITILCYFMDFTILAKRPKIVYATILIASIIAITLSSNITGRHVLFNIPLSYLTLVFPLVFALFVYSLQDKGRFGILLSGIAYLPFAMILLYVPTITGAILYTIISLSIIIFAISRGWYGSNKKQGLMLVLIPTIIISILLVGLILLRSPYAFSRISIIFNPEQDSLGAGYLQILIRDILSQSVMFGKGNAINITQTLPNIRTDFSLVYLIQEFGFIILIAILTLVITFAMFGIRKSVKEKSLLGGIISLTIILTFFLQTVFYIISNIGSGMFASFGLPFISYGDVSLLINSALIGFMLSVFRTGDIFVDNIQKSVCNYTNKKPMFTYQDGKLIIDFKS